MPLGPQYTDLSNENKNIYALQRTLNYQAT